MATLFDLHVLQEKGAAMKKAEYLHTVEFLTESGIDSVGGHIFMHKGMSDSLLIRRLKDEKKFGSSCFDVSEKEVIEIVKKALLDEDNMSDVLDWLNDDSDGENWVVEIENKTPIGHGFFRARWHDWSKGAVPCRTVAVVLAKVCRQYDTTFKIVTAYPEPESTEKDRA